MVREEKSSSREAEARGGDHSPEPLPLRLNVFRSLLPNHVRINLVLHHRPDSVLLRVHFPRRIHEHRNRTRIADKAASLVAALDQPRRQPQEEFARGHGKRFLGRDVVFNPSLRLRWRGIGGEGEELGASTEKSEIRVEICMEKTVSIGGTDAGTHPLPRRVATHTLPLPSLLFLRLLSQ